MKSIERAGYKPGEEVVLALDCASTEFFKNGRYEMTGEGRTLTSAEMAEYLAELCDRYPIMSIEDGMDEDAFEGDRKSVVEGQSVSVRVVLGGRGISRNKH